jgi:uncharacterized membrane protein
MTLMGNPPFTASGQDSPTSAAAPAPGISATILRPDGSDAALRLHARQVIPLIMLASAMYGGVMGSFTGQGQMRWQQIFYSAVKVPLLLGVSFALALPSFFILNTLLGLRADFRSAIRSLATAQAGMAIVLVSLSPFVALWYASSVDYPWAILFNGVMFATATVMGQIMLRRFYKKLINRHPRHRTMVRTWTIVYAFIAIQMAWVLRPFIGGPSEPTTFFRQGAWGNAYVVVGDLIWRAVR